MNNLRTMEGWYLNKNGTDGKYYVIGFVDKKIVCAEVERIDFVEQLISTKNEIFAMEVK